MKKINIKVDKYPKIYQYQIVDTVWEIAITSPQHITISNIYGVTPIVSTKANITSIRLIPKTIGNGVYVEAEIIRDHPFHPSLPPTVSLHNIPFDPNVMDNPLAFLTALVSYMKNRARI